MGSFDIRSALTGRNYVTAKVKFWLEDKVFYDIEDARRRHAVASPEEVDAVDRELDELYRQRDEQAYTLFLRAISNRMNEDIISKALSQVPIQRDMYGREDDARAMERGKLIREMQLAEHMVKIVNPEGEAEVVTDDNRRDIARAIIDEAPVVSTNLIDAAIGELNKKFEAQKLEEQSTDFLSNH